MRLFSSIVLAIVVMTLLVLAPLLAFGAHPDHDARAAVAVATALHAHQPAAAPVSPPAIEPEPTPQPTPRPEPVAPKNLQKDCPCSGACTCGCNDGQPCRCGSLQPMASVTVPLPRVLAPQRAAPVFASGGACRS